MGDRMTKKQRNYIDALARERRKNVYPLLQQIKELVGEDNPRECDMTLYYFDLWVDKRDKYTAQRIITSLLADDYQQLKNILIECGYYMYARHKCVELYGVVDELDLVYI